MLRNLLSFRADLATLMPPMKCLLALLLAVLSLAALAAEQPNILWLTSEDHGPQMGCYGDTFATTPNVDRLAAKGMIYSHAWSCAPVCAPARTTLISALYASSTGSEHMRSLVPFPKGKQMWPQLLREAGYYCSNNAKEDYNLEKPGRVWDESSKNAHWRKRAAKQPFFAVFNSEKSHESKLRVRPHKQVHDPAKVPIPAYHPDSPEVRQDWAQYYDVVSEADADAGKRLQELAAAGLEEDTIIFYFGDHGSGMPRSKRWPFNSGLHVPVVVYFPEKWRHLAPKDYKPGGKSDRLISFVDFGPSVLSLAGVHPPDWMQGHAFMGRFDAAPQPFLHGFRGRMDERYDLVRSSTDGRFVYIRNYMPHVVYGQHLDYMFQTPTTRVWKKLYDAGKLKAPQTFFWQPKPPEELYDLASDPNEVQNLAEDPRHRTVLEKLRAAQRAHLLKIRDAGFLPEPEQHQRAGGESIYDWVRREKNYPLESILEMADVASSLKPEAVHQLTQGLKSSEPGIRYWATMGVLMRGSSAVAPAASDLRKILSDSCPSVRIVAAQALAQFGAKADLSRALDVLAQLASPQANGAYTSMMALNAIDSLGSTAQALVPSLAKIAQKDAKAPNRAQDYTARLLEHISAR